MVEIGSKYQNRTTSVGAWKVNEGILACELNHGLLD